MDELLRRAPSPEAIMRLELLESDLESLQLALDDYLAAKHEVNVTFAARADSQAEVAIPLWPQKAWVRKFHHAKVFVVCMRRFARLLEAAKSRKHEYPQDVGKAIDLAWKKAKTFFDDYREPRNAIEHIDGEVKEHNRRFLNFWDDYLEVVDGKRAHITRTAFETAAKAWSGIVQVIMRPVEARVRVALMEILVRVLHARIDRLTAFRGSAMKSVHSIKAGAVLMILLISSVAFGDEPDFYIDFSTCQNIFGALRLIEQPIITDKGDPVLNACNRKDNRITCRLHF